MSSILNKREFPQELQSAQYIEMCQALSIKIPEKDEWKGAVLFLFCENQIVLIRRSQAVQRHKGQWAFFGGHRDSISEGPREVAFREFEEESALSSRDLEFLGLLPMTTTRQFFPIVPVLAEAKFSLQEMRNQLKGNGEWDMVVSIPLQNFYQENRWSYGRSYFLPNHPIQILYFPLLRDDFDLLAPQSAPLSHNGYLIWGATARMIWNFLRISHKHLP